MIRAILGVAAAAWLLTAGPVDAGDLRQFADRLVGTRPLTLQWLDSQNRGNRGTLTISRQDGRLIASGYQEDQYRGEHNWMRLNGVLTVVNERELELEGAITTRIGYINGGIEHERTGRFRFKAWGARRYWRLQNNRTQPDNGFEVTDYIDIHFAGKNR